ncbi:MAG: enoyl-CoA hydratase/isomerase family protein [Hydrogenophilaceae bacterium]|jgi:enoyl-CoA hydratase|nr:enoyl-CoA hydratase/isomerase family protein [Hydrogenophilaceae bacterium]
MKAHDYERIAVSREGRVLTLTLTAPNPVNAVDAIMHHELARVFLDAQDDSESDLIVLTGAGRAFCAGGDTNWFQTQIERPETFRAIGPEAKRIVASLLDLEKPILCRLNGAAAGLGATIALLCDVIVASEKAVIGDPHVKVGLVAGDGGAVIWPQLIGFARAKELLMTGEMLDAQQAYALGLVNHVVAHDALDAKVAEIAAKILANPRWAVRWTKTIANIPLRALAAQINDAAMGYEMLSNMTVDRREAVAAFLEKRAPKLTGE